MNVLCGNAVDIFTKWVARNSVILTDKLTDLAVLSVSSGCHLTRKSAVVINDLIDTFIENSRTGSNRRHANVYSTFQSNLGAKKLPFHIMK